MIKKQYCGGGFMTFPMTDFLLNYDVYPLVFPVGKEVTVHIRPTGGRPEFTAGKEYKILICALEGGKPYDYPSSGDYREKTVVCNELGGFDVTHTYDSEQQYFIRVLGDEGRRINQFPVYAVEGDLAGRYPLRGDLHMHTNCSDGRQSPEVVCGMYRSHGYDFFAITDHHRYYPSIRAIEFFKDIPTEFNIVPGEEVHLPDVHGKEADAHIVNFGGEYSINALVQDEYYGEAGDSWVRSMPGVTPPESDTVPVWQDKMEALAEKTEVPEKVDKIPAAVMKWAFSEIKKAGGLAIFPHPCWISDTMHVPTPFLEYIMENQDFDAFEVLGGERYYEHNGFQVIRYYEDKAKGRRYPIVGSTDSHSSYESNDGALICSTIVFSPENERKALIGAIKDFYSVAVDTISREFRLVGDNRLVRYSCFLINNYFPRHDELCKEEGRLMRICAVGTEEEKADAVKMLTAINGRMKKFMEKYFAF